MYYPSLPRTNHLHYDVLLGAVHSLFIINRGKNKKQVVVPADLDDSLNNLNVLYTIRTLRN